MNVLSTPSKLVRLLQLADLITSCTVSYVSGEARYAPETFVHVKPLLCTQWGHIGGIGLKIHPDFLYMNLYHWLLGDAFVWKGSKKFDLPIRADPYGFSSNDPSRSPSLASDAPPWPPPEPEEANS